MASTDAAAANVAQMHRFVTEVQQNGNFDLIDKLTHKDFVDHTAAQGQSPNIDGVHFIMRYIHSNIKDLKIEIVHCLSDGNVVATTKYLRGTQVGDLMGKPATNGPIELRIMDFMTVVDGQFKDHWATPSLPLHTDILAYLKNALDPIASEISVTQQQRLQDARKKRKRGQTAPDESVLQLKQVHVAGFGVEQVWEQARRVIDATRKEVELGILEAEAEQDTKPDVSGSQEEDESVLGEEGVDWELDGGDVDEDVQYDGTSDAMDEDLDTDGEIAQDALDEDMELDSEDADERPDEPAEELVTDKFGLNDGFFSIDNFNKQSEFLEQQDARGENDGAASDEEDVDWDADPYLGGAIDGEDEEMTGAAVGVVDDDDDDDEGEAGGFGDPDAPSEDEEDELEAGEMDDMGGMGNTNNIMYKDFFAPPAQKKRPNKKGRPNPHNFPAKTASNINSAAEVDEDAEETERNMAAVHRELFEDEESEEEEEENELDPGDPKSRKSAHERRRAAIAEEIRKLEAANVAKRDWTLSGEARAADRPINSLLEEDLDFERAGKPVPVITAEVSESIEELIRRRILAQDFQDIIRRRPNDLATGKGRRGKLDFELDDSKSKKGLAEEYEEEHLRQTDPTYVDAKDEKLAKEHKEIGAMWRDISSKLDSLSSWHFRPKQPTAQIDIRVDAPTITMEDARPSAGGDVAGASQLAPQEIYKAGEAANGNNAEVVGKSGLPSGREELSREDRKRRRRREKERIRKAGGNESEKTESKGAKEKRDVVSDLKKGGVKVIGKKGEMKDVQGRAIKEAEAGSPGGSRFKL
nr:hypothetical protein B0A51_05349 [Rachicladosporium sp. CCFEE 5018]OQO31932.1 hypothetical protein B0A51_01127 [Rachicladosporium sp. CCFEE 5018]